MGCGFLNLLSYISFIKGVFLLLFVAWKYVAFRECNFLVADTKQTKKATEQSSRVLTSYCKGKQIVLIDVKGYGLNHLSHACAWDITFSPLGKLKYIMLPRGINVISHT